MSKNIPKLVTFDGEARSGKGTIVQKTKDYLRDECGYKVMLIDRGQTFRVLVVAAQRAGVDLDNPSEIDKFLDNQQNVANCVQFVKDVYHMNKDERDSLLYSNQVGENSAKVGARPASQVFVADLTKKWLADAGREGFDVVLVDGRSLESIAIEMHEEGLCDYRIGFYFVCDPYVGAKRTLGHARKHIEDLTDKEQTDVEQLVSQIYIRNKRDFERDAEKLVQPADALSWRLPDVAPNIEKASDRPMIVVDTSAKMSKAEMSLPVSELCGRLLFQ